VLVDLGVDLVCEFSFRRVPDVFLVEAWTLEVEDVLLSADHTFLHTGVEVVAFVVRLHFDEVSVLRGVTLPALANEAGAFEPVEAGEL